jgi:hypothetical protein
MVEASWFLRALDLLGDQSNTLLVSLLLNHSDSLKESVSMSSSHLIHFDSYLVIDETGMLPFVSPYFSIRVVESYLAGVDVDQVERVARESNASRLSALYQECVLVSWFKSIISYCIPLISSPNIPNRT